MGKQLSQLPVNWGHVGLQTLRRTSPRGFDGERGLPKGGGLPCNVAVSLSPSRMQACKCAGTAATLAWSAPGKARGTHQPSHQQAVATATPSSKKSTTTADSTVSTECHALSPNLRNAASQHHSQWGMQPASSCMKASAWESRPTAQAACRAAPASGPVPVGWGAGMPCETALCACVTHVMQ